MKIEICYKDSVESPSYLNLLGDADNIVLSGPMALNYL